LIILKDVHYSYEPEGVAALRGISLKIKEGDYIALVGPNGCGKTTFIRQLNALLLPKKGAVWVDGLDTKITRNHAEIRSRVGMVFQNPDDQIVGMTVEEDVAFGPENLRLPAEEIKKRVAESLKRIGIADLVLRNTETLSGGEKRLIAIAGVLAMQPRYIALDEPTAFLDPAAAGNILDIMGKLHREGIGIIHVTHNMAQAALAQRMIVMNEGQICLDGPPALIFRNVEMLQKINLRLPHLTQLLIKLKEKGYPARTDIFEVTDAANHIEELFRRT